MTCPLFTVAIATLLATVLQAAGFPLTPRLAGGGWTVAANPDLGPLNNSNQQRVDFGGLQAPYAIRPQEKLRVIIETDAGGDPDDEQSLVRFLLYANEWNVEGIIANRPTARSGENLNPVRTGLGIVQQHLSAYGEVYHRLREHAPDFPTKQYLWERTVAGYGHSDAGVNLIVAAVDRDDPRPVWFQNWGTDRGSDPSNLKRALDKVLAERGPAGYAAFKNKIRLCSADKFGDHTTNTASPWRLWVNASLPNMDGGNWYHRFGPLTATAGGFDLRRDVLTDHGPLGALYPTNTNIRQKEGDSYYFLHLIPTGMNDPMQPGWGSWAGRFGIRDAEPRHPNYYWANLRDVWQGTTNRDNTLKRWAADLQNDFRARLDWCVKPFAEANHPPVAALNGDTGKRILTLTAKPNSTVRLTAVDSTDPDHHTLSYRWTVYPEAGTYPNVVRVTTAEPAEASVSIPVDAAGNDIHVILTVRDDGQPPLASYRRAVIQVDPPSAAESNLVYNGDFESDTSKNPPAGWAMWGAQSSKIPDHFTRDTSQGHEGKASFRIYHPRQSQGYIVTAPEHAIRPKEAMTYTVSFWAKADAPARTTFGLTAYESVNPFRDAPTPGAWPIQVTTEWKSYSFQVHEGLEFFASRCRYLLLTFRATSDPAEERTLWVDDVVVVERPNPHGVRLIDEDSLTIPPVRHRLRQGERFALTLDPQLVARPVTRDLAGVSFHRVAGWTGLPYDKQGQYVLAPELEEAIREMHLPMTRFYAVGHEAFPVEESIDKAAAFCRRIGVPLDHVVLELEDQSANLKLEANDWGRAVRHSVSKGYAFRHWEVGNEVYSQTFSAKSPMGQAFDTPDDYIAHVKAVSAAVKAAQPGAQLGLSINMGNLQWGGYVLKQAAGAYDFVCPHLYAVWQTHGRKFETVNLTENFQVLERAERLKALVRAYNEGREVYVYDTEWGMHSSGPQGERADDVYRNGNLWGAMHRAVRMIYYLREGTLRGASSWEMFCRLRSPGFGFVSKDAPDRRFLLYWLYYYLNRHLGESVLELDGTAPYYAPAAGDDRYFKAGELPGPLTPTLATLSADRKTIYLVIANASWEKAIPGRIDLRHFVVKSAGAIALSQRDPEGHPLVERKEDAAGELPVVLTDNGASLIMPARSVAFVQLRSEATP